MRFTLPVLLLVAPFALAADPKPDPQKAADKYAGALQKTAALLAKVTDEASAAEAKPKLDDLHDEAREARKQMFRAIAEVDSSDREMAAVMGDLAKGVRTLTEAITTEVDRIAGNHKAAYKILRESKQFAALEKEYEVRAAVKADTLMTCAKSWMVRNDSRVPKLEDLAALAEEGKKATTDPWGFPYQLVLKADKDGRTRLYIWTVNPFSGKKLGTPPPDEKEEKK